MVAIKKRVCYSQIPEEGAFHVMPSEATRVSIRVYQEAEGEGEGRTVEKSLYCGSQRKEWWRRLSRLRLAHFNNFIWLWGKGAVPSCLAPGDQGWLEQVDSGLHCDSLIKAVNGDVSSALVSLYLEKCLQEEDSSQREAEWQRRQEVKARWLGHIIGLSRQGVSNICMQGDVKAVYRS